MDLYASIEQRSRDALQALKERALPVAAKVHRAIASVLGVQLCELDGENVASVSFMSLGGDSLSAVRMCEILRDTCGEAPPVGLLLDASTSVDKLVRFMEAHTAPAMADSADVRLSFRQVHGRDDAKTASTTDLALGTFLPKPSSSLSPVSAAAQHVLMTGANGFLGRFLLLELLSSLHAREDGGSKVSVIIRATDATTAKQRLRAAYGGLVSELDAFDAQGMLQVYAGDLMLPRLGLSADVYDMLGKDVDTVLHNGALVNHMLTYPQLFEPNVIGTVEVMRFACENRIKPVTFVSTVAVAADSKRAVVTEEDRASKLWQQRPISDEYASGYATSKWACEILLEQLASHHQVPVNIVRSSMVMPHTRLGGQFNRVDFLTRLLVGVIRTGMRPESFYACGEHDGEAAAGCRPHFDGMPVDVTSAGMSAIALHQRAGFHLFHAVNAHDDGISLDTFLEWAAGAGYSLSTVKPYEAWYAAYGAALRKLPDDVRNSTNLAILFQWQQPISHSSTKFDNRVFCQVLTQWTRFHDGVPHLDAAFVRHYLEQLHKASLI